MALLAPRSELRERLASARPAELPADVLEAITSLCAAVGAEGLRADLVICRGAAALAGWEGRHETTVDDVRKAVLSGAVKGQAGPW